MKNTAFSLLALLTLALLSAPGCTDPTAIGAELLEEDQVGTGFTDTVSIEGRTIQGDTVRTYGPNGWLDAFFLGNMVDPVFGRTKAAIYSSPTLYLDFTTLNTINPKFADDAHLDSIVLVLPYKLDRCYGDFSSDQFSVDVLELFEGVDAAGTYTNEDSIEFINGVVLGSSVFTPNFDSIQVIDYPGGVPDTLEYPHLRIPMSTQFGERLLQSDSLDFVSDSAFWNIFKGLKIRANTDTKGMLAFNLNPNDDTRGGIYVYYTEADTLKKHYQFPFTYTSPTFGQFKNEYKGSAVEPFLQLGSQEDSLLFVQGTQGLFARIRFPNLSGLSGLVVNKAELVANLATLDGDDLDAYEPGTQLYMSVFNSTENTYDPITDIVLADLSAPVVFGGQLTDNGSGKPKVYRFNLSTYFQDMIDGDAEPVVYIYLSGRRSTANRSVLYGPSHPLYPMKLNLSFSERVQ